MQYLGSGLQVNIVSEWGVEEDIISAARQSTDGSFRGWEKDAKLLRFMYENNHTTPFEFCGAVFEIKAPLFVLNQIVRHRTFSFNVFSMRYSKANGNFYTPAEWKEQAEKNRQGSGKRLDAQSSLDKLYEETMAKCFDTYEAFLAAGMSKEQARLVLPQSTMTQWRMAGNLHNWLKFLRLRTASDVQEETRCIASEIEYRLTLAFPHVLNLYFQEKKDGCKEEVRK